MLKADDGPKVPFGGSYTPSDVQRQAVSAVTTAGELAEHLRQLVVATLEDVERAHLPDWRIPRFFAGHQVAADVRADVCFTLHHLARAGVGEVAGRPLDQILIGLLGDIDGAGTHTFFSYRIAETLLAHGRFDGSPLLRAMSDAQVAQVAQAVDSSDWLELLDAGVLPRNYAGVLARCELRRVHLGLVDDTARLDGLVERVRGVVGANPLGALDDSNDGIGRYDIYTADVWLFTEPLADRLGEVWERGMARALDLVLAVGDRHGTSVPWGRSTGDLSTALTLELAAFAMSRPESRSGRHNEHRARDPQDDPTGFGLTNPAVWLRRAVDATTTLLDGFDDGGLTTAHAYRAQDAYRGPERRLQLTFDLLGKIAWAAAALGDVDPDLTPASAREAYPPVDRLVAFETGRPAGVWAHRSAGAGFAVPFVGATRSHYLPALHRPGRWEVPVDRDLPTWTPLVIDRLKRFTAGGLPNSVEHRDGRVVARWESFIESGAGVEGEEATAPLAGSRTMDLSVEGRTIVLRDDLTFDRPPVAVGVMIPEVADVPLTVEWQVDRGEGQATTVPVDGVSEWRSSWSELAKVHQLDLTPARSLSYSVRVTPLIRAGSTAFGSHYHQALYPAMRDRVVERRSPVGWDAVDDPGFRSIDLLHLHWPEWTAFDDLDEHRRIVEALDDADIPIVWTAHNLTPHEKQPEIHDPIYQLWAGAVAGVIHHSAWGEARLRSRYDFGAGCVHRVIPHGHFGATWNATEPPDRAEAERRLGLSPAGLRIGIVGAPRAEKLVQQVLDGVAACSRDDVQLVCWSLRGDELVPDDPRIPIAEAYRNVDAAHYATRLVACDVLALVFDEAGDMLTTGAAGDSVGFGLPTLRSEWGYLTEHLGAAGLPVGQTSASIAAALDSLTDADVDRARRGALRRRKELDWSVLAPLTADLFDNVLRRGTTP